MKKVFDRARSRWLVALSYLTFIYTIIPYTRDIYRIVNKSMNVSTFIYVLYISIGMYFIALAIETFRYQLRYYLYLIILLAIYGYSLQNFTVAIPEKIHFIQYGLLTLVVFWAMNKNLEGRSNIWLTLATVTILGWIDELIQYIIPDRYYDPRDIFLNIWAGILAIIFIALLKHALKNKREHGLRPSSR